jgi:hypothetical protein
MTGPLTHRSWREHNAKPGPFVLPVISGRSDRCAATNGVKYEVVVDGDKLVMAGSLIPQGDGSFVVDLDFVPSEGTGRFAGAAGRITYGKATPGPGYIFEGTIATVGATK